MYLGWSGKVVNNQLFNIVSFEYTPCFIKSGPLCICAITFYLGDQFQ